MRNLDDKKIVVRYKAGLFMRLLKSAIVFWLFFIAPVSPVTSASQNVLLITLDTTRADHLGCYGFKNARTPNLDQLAAGGARFAYAFSSVPLTLPSHATLLTGLLPFHTGVRDMGLTRLPESIPTLAEILHGHGYQTRAFIAAAVLDRVFGLDHGFQVYDDNVRVGRPEDFNYQERAASQVNDAVRAELGGISAPYFIWVHYYDAHAPYVPPKPFDQQFKENPYDGEIAFVDWAVGDLINALRERHLLDHTIIIVAGDHGEGLGDHGENTHGVFLYDSLLHVPLIFYDPGQIKAGTVVAAQAGLADVMPTLLEYLGIQPPARLDGASLKSAIDSGKAAVKEIYEESFLPLNSFGWSPLFALRTPEWHFILAPRPELYDLRKDPAEKANVYSSNTQVAGELQKNLKAYPYQTGPSEETSIPPELREKFESLGYVSGHPIAARKNLLDPKDGVGLMNKIDQARVAGSGGKAAEGEKLLGEVLRQNPENVSARAALGNIYMSQKKYDQAQKEFETALQYKEFDYLYFDLGNSLASRGMNDAAIEKYQKALALNPRNIGAYLGWARLELARGNSDICMKVLDQAISRQLRDPEAYLMRGRLEAARGNVSSAIPYFQEALRQNPDSVDAHAETGHALYQQRKIDQAIAEYQKAIQLRPNDVELLKTLGSIFLFDKNDTTAAQNYFRQALSLLKPDDPDAAKLRQILQQ